MHLKVVFEKKIKIGLSLLYRYGARFIWRWLSKSGYAIVLLEPQVYSIQIESVHPHAIVVLVVKYEYMNSYNSVNWQIILVCGCTQAGLLILWCFAARATRSRWPYLSEWTIYISYVYGQRLPLFFGCSVLACLFRYFNLKQCQIQRFRGRVTIMQMLIKQSSTFSYKINLGLVYKDRHHW